MSADQITTEKHRVRRTFWHSRARRLGHRLSEFEGDLRLDRDALSAFLLIGSVPGTATLFEGVQCLPGGCRVNAGPHGLAIGEMFRYPKQAVSDRAESELLVEATRLLRDAADRCLSSSNEVLLPLSGGLDSRTLLALLLERRSPHEIHTYTYGIPGTLDFEIGNRVAALAQTRHTTIDLRQMEFTADRVVETARLSDSNTNLFHCYVWTEVLKRFGTGMTIWSGYTGDGIGGGFFQPSAGMKTEDSVRRFLDLESRTLTWHSGNEQRKRARELAASLVATESKYDDVLGRLEAIWFANHVERYTTHQIFMNGFDYRIPFMDDAFATLILNLESHHRMDKQFFDRFVSTVWPEVFAVPTRCSGYGLSSGRLRAVRQATWVSRRILRKVGYRISPRRVMHPDMGYLDFRVALTDREDVRSTARELVLAFAERGLLERRRVLHAWEQHQKYRNQTSLVPTLASLEAILRAYRVP